MRPLAARLARGQPVEVPEAVGLGAERLDRGLEHRARVDLGVGDERGDVGQAVPRSPEGADGAARFDEAEHGAALGGVPGGAEAHAAAIVCRRGPGRRAGRRLGGTLASPARMFERKT